MPNRVPPLAWLGALAMLLASTPACAAADDLAESGARVTNTFAQDISGEDGPWIRAAAYHGNAHAQFALGVRHYTGRGAPKDDIEALAWILLAAAGGDRDAARTLEAWTQEFSSQEIQAARQRSLELSQGMLKSQLA